MPSHHFSIVEFFGGDKDDSEESSCGYCKTIGSVSTGMWAHNLSVKDYQDLIDRGWRRSGCYCYKPKMDSTCCPAYTIKCDALKFNLSKSQKKVLKKMNKYLQEGRLTNEKEKVSNSEDFKDDDGPCIDLPDLTTKAEIKISEKVIKDGTIVVENMEPGKAKFRVKWEGITMIFPPIETKAVSSSNEATSEQQNSPEKPVSAGTGCLRPCKKAKLLRKERRVERLLKKGLNPDNVKPNPAVKTLEEHLAPPNNAKHKLELRLVQTSPQSDEYKATEQESYEVYKKYQVSVHDDPPDKVTLRQFTRFLVDSPLEPEEGENGTKFGSFHQQYWLDGKLIAVAVIDILPNSISSVYFYYNPDFRFLTLGTYAALREIALTRDLNKQTADLAFYYMGFYIHSCPKMRYKGQYTPSYLLCPVSYTWHPIEKCKALLDKTKYSEFSPLEAEKPVGYGDLEKMLVLHRRRAMPFKIYANKQHGLPDDEILKLKLYLQLVGSVCASRILIYRE